MSADQPCYIWKNGQVVIRMKASDPYSSRYFGYYGCPVVDLNYHDRSDRIGIYSGPRSSPVWQELREDELPKEFRTSLLLLGVSV